jgi:hypothetical protein
MKRVSLFSLFLALIFSVAVPRGGGQSDGIDKKILDDFPGFHVLTVSELPPALALVPDSRNAL